MLSIRIRKACTKGGNMTDEEQFPKHNVRKGRRLSITLVLLVACLTVTISKVDAMAMVKTTDDALETEQLGEYFLTSQPTMEYTEEDVNLLATTIYAEAGICDEMEEYRVGTVIVNRVNDTTDTFEDTVEGVIYQKGQFGSIGSDAWNHGPTDKEMEIARNILEGARVFPSQVVWFNKESPYGELYYTSDWHEFSGWEREE